MKIRELRRSKDLTQEDLAKILGVSRTTVAMWETGRVMPASDKLPELAKVLGCTIDELYGASRVNENTHCSEDCVDCVHFDACKRLINSEKEEFPRCELFKSKDNFVEVVRCGECRYYMNKTEARGKVPGAGFCIRPGDTPVTFKLEIDFCQWGKEKE